MASLFRMNGKKKQISEYSKPPNAHQALKIKEVQITPRNTKQEQREQWARETVKQQQTKRNSNLYRATITRPSYLQIQWNKEIENELRKKFVCEREDLESVVNKELYCNLIPLHCVAECGGSDCLLIHALDEKEAQLPKVFPLKGKPLLTTSGGLQSQNNNSQLQLSTRSWATTGKINPKDLFDLEAYRKQPGDKAFVGRKEFEQNFDIFTEGLLDNLNWDNVFFAGGGVAACLLPIKMRDIPGLGQSNATRRLTKQQKREYFHNIAYTGSDIDLFLYGFETEEQANQKLQEIYFSIVDNLPVTSLSESTSGVGLTNKCPALCFRSQHAVTIVSAYPYRHVQIVCRLYKSPAEVLMGFDVDSCSVGFDGSNVWMTPRMHYATVKQYNSVDISRRSPTYESRLAKYAKRGYEILVDGLDRGLVDPQIFERPIEKVNGLQKLLFYERFSSAEERKEFRQRFRKGGQTQQIQSQQTTTVTNEQPGMPFHFRRRMMKMKARRAGRFGGNNNDSDSENDGNVDGSFSGTFAQFLQRDLSDRFLLEQLDKHAEFAQGASDYTAVFLPWGPNWDCVKVRDMVYTKEMLLNSQFVDPLGVDGKRRICQFGTAEEVINGPEDSDSEDEGDFLEDDEQEEVDEILDDDDELEIVEMEDGKTQPPIDPDLKERIETLKKPLLKYLNRGANNRLTKKERKQQQDANEKDRYVKGPLQWMKTNPGQQSIGSFHPITEGEWMQGVHLLESSEILAGIICRSRKDFQLNGVISLEQLEKEVKQKIPKMDDLDWNVRDPAGRTLLMLAALVNNAVFAQFLLQRGAKMNARLLDGRSVLHLCAQYGSFEVAKVCLQAAVQLNTKLRVFLDEKEKAERKIAKIQHREDERVKNSNKFSTQQKWVVAAILKKRRAREAQEIAQAFAENEYLDKLFVDDKDFEKQMTPIQYAVWFGQEKIVELLLSQDDLDVYQVLELPGQKMEKKKMKIGVEMVGGGGGSQGSGGNVKDSSKESDDQQEEHYLPGKGRKTLQKVGFDKKVLERSGTGVPLLHLACYRKNVKILELLLKNKACIMQFDSKQRSCLHICAEMGFIEGFKLIFESGQFSDAFLFPAGNDLLRQSGTSTGSSSFTQLQQVEAQSQSQPEQVSTNTNTQNQPSYQGQGVFAAPHQIQFQKQFLLNFFDQNLAHKSDSLNQSQYLPQFSSQYGQDHNRTPLLYALEAGHYDLVKYLLTLGAYPHYCIEHLQVQACFVKMNEKNFEESGGNINMQFVKYVDKFVEKHLKRGKKDDEDQPFSFHHHRRRQQQNQNEQKDHGKFKLLQPVICVAELVDSVDPQSQNDTIHNVDQDEQLLNLMNTLLEWTSNQSNQNYQPSDYIKNPQFLQTLFQNMKNQTSPKLINNSLASVSNRLAFLDTNDAFKNTYSDDDDDDNSQNNNRGFGFSYYNRYNQQEAPDKKFKDTILDIILKKVSRVEKKLRASFKTKKYAPTMLDYYQTVEKQVPGDSLAGYVLQNLIQEEKNNGGVSALDDENINKQSGNNSSQQQLQQTLSEEDRTHLQSRLQKCVQMMQLLRGKHNALTHLQVKTRKCRQELESNKEELANLFLHQQNQKDWQKQEELGQQAAVVAGGGGGLFGGGGMGMFGGGFPGQQNQQMGQSGAGDAADKLTKKEQKLQKVLQEVRELTLLEQADVQCIEKTFGISSVIVKAGDLAGGKDGDDGSGQSGGGGFGMRPMRRMKKAMKRRMPGGFSSNSGGNNGENNDSDEDQADLDQDQQILYNLGFPQVDPQLSKIQRILERNGKNQDDDPYGHRFGMFGMDDDENSQNQRKETVINGVKLTFDQKWCAILSKMQRLQESFGALELPESRVLQVLTLDRFCGSPEMAGNYLALYEAIINGDLQKVNELCSGDQQEAQCLVAVKSEILGLTPVDLAFEVTQNGKKGDEILRALIQHAHRQATPLPDVGKSFDSIEEANLFLKEFSDQFLQLQIGSSGSGGFDGSYQVHVDEGQLASIGQQSNVGGDTDYGAIYATKRKGHKLMERMEQYKSEAQAEQSSNKASGSAGVAAVTFTKDGNQIQKQSSFASKKNEPGTLKYISISTIKDILLHKPNNRNNSLLYALENKLTCKLQIVFEELTKLKVLDFDPPSTVFNVNTLSFFTTNLLHNGPEQATSKDISGQSQSSAGGKSKSSSKNQNEIDPSVKPLLIDVLLRQNFTGSYCFNKKQTLQFNNSIQQGESGSLVNLGKPVCRATYEPPEGIATNPEIEATQYPSKEPLHFDFADINIDFQQKIFSYSYNITGDDCALFNADPEQFQHSFPAMKGMYAKSVSYTTYGGDKKAKRCGKLQYRWAENQQQGQNGIKEEEFPNCMFGTFITVGQFSDGPSVKAVIPDQVFIQLAVDQGKLSSSALDSAANSDQGIAKNTISKKFQIQPASPVLQNVKLFDWALMLNDIEAVKMLLDLDTPHALNLQKTDLSQGEKAYKEWYARQFVDQELGKQDLQVSLQAVKNCWANKQLKVVKRAVQASKKKQYNQMASVAEYGSSAQTKTCKDSMSKKTITNANTSLHHACYSDSVESVKFLLEGDLDAFVMVEDIEADHKQTPTKQAGGGFFQLTDRDINGESCFHIAAREGNWATFEYLLDYQARNQQIVSNSALLDLLVQQDVVIYIAKSAQQATTSQQQGGFSDEEFDFHIVSNDAFAIDLSSETQENTKTKKKGTSSNSSGNNSQTFSKKRRRVTPVLDLLIQALSKTFAPNKETNFVQKGAQLLQRVVKIVQSTETSKDSQQLSSTSKNPMLMCLESLLCLWDYDFEQATQSQQANNNNKFSTDKEFSNQLLKLVFDCFSPLTKSLLADVPLDVDAAAIAASGSAGGNSNTALAASANAANAQQGGGLNSPNAGNRNRASSQDGATSKFTESVFHAFVRREAKQLEFFKAQKAKKKKAGETINMQQQNHNQQYKLLLQTLLSKANTPAPAEIPTEQQLLQIVNNRNSLNQTPLHVAAQTGAPVELLIALLEFGADITALDISGAAPVHLAAKNGFTELIQVLSDGIGLGSTGDFKSGSKTSGNQEDASGNTSFSWSANLDLQNVLMGSICQGGGIANTSTNTKTLVNKQAAIESETQTQLEKERNAGRVFVKADQVRKHGEFMSGLGKKK